jgi:HlyD family secretion protein
LVLSKKDGEGQTFPLILPAAGPSNGDYLMKKKRIWMFLAALIVALAISATFLLREEDSSTDAYRTATVKRGNIKAVVSSTGKLAPLNTVTVGSQVSGNIKALYADYNSAVKKDQVVALIDPAIYEGQVSQAGAKLLHARMQLHERQKETAAARAGVLNAEAGLFSARAMVREAELNYTRLADLTGRRVVPDADLDSALARRDNARGNLEMALAKVTTAKVHLEMALAQEECAKALIAEREADLSLAEIKLGYCTIRSSIDGVVISRDVDVGQTVAATLQSPVLFTTAEDLTRMQVEVDVSEADVGRIRTGQDVEFTVDAFPDRTFRASVRQVRNAATSIQNVVTYKIIADVNNDSLLLRPGMTANVTVMVATVNDSLTIPNSALRFKPLGKVKEAKAQEQPSIQDRRLYKKTVEALGLDKKQSEEFARIIQHAQEKLKAAYSLPEDSRDTERAWRGFFVQVFTRLHKILREDQYEKFMAYRSKLKDAGEKRRRERGRQATVYVPGKEGPVAVRVMVGITDDNETQIIGGELKEGDRVIVGLALGSEKDFKPSGNLLSNLLRKGR